MTYKFISFDTEAKKTLIWGTFKNDKKKMFLFASYLLGANDPGEFYIMEVETGKVVKLEKFARKNNITKEDIKSA